MSSTNRGYVRHASDYYVTPIPAIVHFLKEWAKDEPALKSVRQILDPCAGGTMQKADGTNALPKSYPVAILRLSIWAQSVAIETLDIRPDSTAEFIGDYLTLNPVTIPDLIITNPPFSLAQEITEKALRDVTPSGFVVMLQRINWLGSEKRREWWQANMPQRIYVHSERMNFTPGQRNAQGKLMHGDSIEYAHFVWRRESGNKSSQLRVI